MYANTVSRRVFLLSKLRYTVDTDNGKLFCNTHIKPNIDYTVHQSCGTDVVLFSKRDYILCTEEPQN